MEVNVTELSQLRDQLLEKRALQQQAKADSEKAINSLQPMIDKLLSSYGDKLTTMGVDMSVFQNLDYNRLQNDSTYLGSVKEHISNITTDLQKKIEELLDV